MLSRKLAGLLALAPFLFGGCLVEPSPNAPSANVGEAGNENRAADAQRFERFLRGATTRAAPTLAVPGLSPHGQARAFDFQVMRGQQLVAAPSSPGAWDSAGWTEKVREAVTRASTKFAGPLASPREPWHYDYRP